MVVVVTADIVRRSLLIQTAAVRLCPVDTGRLRASITHEIEPTGLHITGRVGTNVEYAPFVELGTSHGPSQPFLRPALAAGAI